MSINKIFLTGNVGKNPDIKTTESGKKVAKFSLATTDRNKEKTTQWHNIIVWEKLAEIVEKYVHKGDELTVIGPVQYRSYTDKEGVTKYFTEVIANEVNLHRNIATEQVEQPKDNQGEWKGKKEIGPMSDVSELPGNIDDGSVPDDNLPF